MVNEKIRKLRKKLNDSIAKEKDYYIIYNISVELDEAIAEYYDRKIRQQIRRLKRASQEYLGIDTFFEFNFTKNIEK